ncbi:hypothetical protein ATE47_02120 [Chryseobacterium sp. IHB B 17019]|uniref:hypothetical protein n=1 Tax=Chryseobacterium sp. IHB B 17019 TaxID=1721091 RepID=UPI0007217DBF|nr:hypothetical protein [Chryseobacterium sp. IHB B 17019]ALR29402.1 hypothetical protein ATE47_02120 [Chryseobacterium sp. IHB B 17019]
MKKKITAEKKAEKVETQNYDLSNNMQKNGNEQKIKQKTKMEAIEINLSELDIDILKILDVEIDMPELDITELNMEIPEMNIDFPEIEFPEMGIDLPDLLERTDFEFPDFDSFIEQ